MWCSCVPSEIQTGPRTMLGRVHCAKVLCSAEMQTSLSCVRAACCALDGVAFALPGLASSSFAWQSTDGFPRAKCREGAGLRTARLQDATSPFAALRGECQVPELGGLRLWRKEDRRDN